MYLIVLDQEEEAGEVCYVVMMRMENKLLCSYEESWKAIMSAQPPKRYVAASLPDTDSHSC